MYKYVKSDSQKTNYRFSDKYIPGNDVTPEELYNQVLHNYITDKVNLKQFRKSLKEITGQMKQKLSDTSLMKLMKKSNMVMLIIYLV